MKILKLKSATPHRAPYQPPTLFFDMCVVCIVFFVMVFVVRLVFFCDTFRGMTCGCVFFFPAVTRVFCVFFCALEHQKSKIKHKKTTRLYKKMKHRPPVIPKQHLALSYHIIAISSKLTSSRHRTISIPDGGANQCSWPQKNTMHHKLQAIKFTLGWDPLGFMIPPFVTHTGHLVHGFPF